LSGIKFYGPDYFMNEFRIQHSLSNPAILEVSEYSRHGRAAYEDGTTRDVVYGIL